METKELYFRVLEKFNCKDTIKRYKICLHNYDTGDGTHIIVYYSTPTPGNPQNYEERMIYYEHSNKGIGFSVYSTHVIECPITESEAIEVEYIIHSIRKKLKDIAYDELLELL